MKETRQDLRYTPRVKAFWMKTFFFPRKMEKTRYYAIIFSEKLGDNTLLSGFLMMALMKESANLKITCIAVGLPVSL